MPLFVRSTNQKDKTSKKQDKLEEAYENDVEVEDQQIDNNVDQHAVDDEIEYSL